MFPDRVDPQLRLELHGRSLPAVRVLRSIGGRRIASSLAALQPVLEPAQTWPEGNNRPGATKACGREWGFSLWSSMGGGLPKPGLLLPTT